jgi:hypothetical protein
MNFFTFQTSDSHGFQISGQFWIFIAITLPLTFVTVGYWWWKTIRHRKQKEKQRNLLGISPIV